MPENSHQDYAPQSADRDLALMLRAVGAKETEPKDLGRNHPHLRPSEPGPYNMAEHSDQMDQAGQVDLAENPLDKKFTPIERARRLSAFMDKTGYNKTRTAAVLGCSRSHISNILRLANLSPRLQELLITGQIKIGHARAVATMPDPEALADIIIKNKLSVRAAETLARRLRYVGPNGRLIQDTAIPNTDFAEQILENALECRAKVRDYAGRGTVTLRYPSPRIFKEIMGRLTRPTPHWRYE